LEQRPNRKKGLGQTRIKNAPLKKGTGLFVYIAGRDSLGFEGVCTKASDRPGGIDTWWKRVYEKETTHKAKTPNTKKKKNKKKNQNTAVGDGK